MTSDYPDPAVDEIPTLDEVGPYYDGLLELAAERLDGPIQTRICTYEDGEFEIRVYHGYGPHPQRPGSTYRHVLRYHSGDDEAIEALLEVDIDSVEKQLVYRTRVADGARLDAGRVPQENAESARRD